MAHLLQILVSAEMCTCTIVLVVRVLFYFVYDKYLGRMYFSFAACISSVFRYIAIVDYVKASHNYNGLLGVR